jgi:hypothetical protein
VIGNNIFQEMCKLDLSDRNLGLPTAWHDLIELVKRINAYDDKTDVAGIADSFLVLKKGLVERKESSFEVKLTQAGRKECDRGIYIHDD